MHSIQRVVRWVCRFGVVLLFAALAPFRAAGQSQPPLPVYLVTQAGAQPAQATALATFLNLPANRITLTNGELSFLDASNFLSVPTLPVTDPAITSNLLVQTLNKFPALPLAFQQLDFNSLAAETPFSSNSAVSLTTSALANAGLTPQLGTPSGGYSTLLAFYTNDQHSVISVSNALDTQVDYSFTLSGYPLVGPGAQVHFNYAPYGSVTDPVTPRGN